MGIRTESNENTIIIGLTSTILEKMAIHNYSLLLFSAFFLSTMLAVGGGSSSSTSSTATSSNAVDGRRLLAYLKYLESRRGWVVSESQVKRDRTRNQSYRRSHRRVASSSYRRRSYGNRRYTSYRRYSKPIRPTLERIDIKPIQYG